MGWKVFPYTPICSSTSSVGLSEPLLAIFGSRSTTPVAWLQSTQYHLFLNPHTTILYFIGFGNHRRQVNGKPTITLSLQLVLFRSEPMFSPRNLIKKYILKQKITLNCLFIITLEVLLRSVPGGLQELAHPISRAYNRRCDLDCRNR